MSERLLTRCIVAYIVVAVLTFGYSYNADYEQPKTVWVTATEINSARALAAGWAWPLYWTVKAFSGLRPKGAA